MSSAYINFVDVWNENKLICSKDDYNYTNNNNVPAYCVLIDQYKAESYRFYKNKMIIYGSDLQCIYIWRPGLW